jgi:hypothetical protein
MKKQLIQFFAGVITAVGLSILLKYFGVDDYSRGLIAATISTNIIWVIDKHY